MTSSLKRRSLSKPEQGVKIHPFDLGFVRTRNKNKAHSLLLELFEESDLSKADLAKMLGKKPEQITRWLAGPGNLKLDTLSDLIFAMKGEFFVVQCKDELSRGKSNRQSPEWLTTPVAGKKWEHVSDTSGGMKSNETGAPKVRYSVNISSKASQKEHQYDRYETIPNAPIAAVP
ncbi:helix-turn-helix domain-containing protein [Tritonibacter mobilis]|uniref:helix-turn-helix domain-containing protein n=1 Tax=Tritonibacter mobilis TaxID=379347 RepID=UPI0013A5BCCF|nr:helix-turn-helix transcriptional regulator [Tritonibacter mobilis]